MLLRRSCLPMRRAQFQARLRQSSSVACMRSAAADSTGALRKTVRPPLRMTRSAIVCWKYMFVTAATAKFAFPSRSVRIAAGTGSFLVSMADFV